MTWLLAHTKQRMGRRLISASARSLMEWNPSSVLGAAGFVVVPLDAWGAGPHSFNAKANPGEAQPGTGWGQDPATGVKQLFERFFRGRLCGVKEARRQRKERASRTAASFSAVKTRYPERACRTDSAHLNPAGWRQWFWRDFLPGRPVGQRLPRRHRRRFPRGCPLPGPDGARKR